jgi:hypothetical protein
MNQSILLTGAVASSLFTGVQAQERGLWVIDTLGLPMTTFAYLDSENSDAALFLRCREGGQYDIYVAFEMSMDDDHSVFVRFDQMTPFPVDFVLSDDGDAIFFNDIYRVTIKLREARRLQVQANQRAGRRYIY